MAPSNFEIQQEATPPDGPSRVLLKYMAAFSKYRKRNLILYYSGFLFGFPDSNIQEADMEGFMSAIYKMPKECGLDLFLHTPGGSVPATEGIGTYLRSVFGTNISVFVPHMAMSCGTLLAMCAQTIYMGKHSCLGPIDPALGGYRTDAIVEEFNQARKDIAENPNLALLWQPIISKYPMTLLGECKKATELARQVSQDWLCSGMLEGATDAQNRLDSILRLFAQHEISKTHDRHISAQAAQDAGLSVKLIEEDNTLQDLTLSLHHATTLLLREKRLSRLITNTSLSGLFSSVPNPRPRQQS